MGDTGVEYKKTWLACFDLLGFERRVRAFDLGGALGEYLDVLKRVELRSKVVHTKWFSDTFVFWTDDDSQGSFSDIACSCHFFFRSMITTGIPLRGALTVGDFFVDEAQGILIGPALIDAYRCAEQQDWIGFILTEDATEVLKTYHGGDKTVYDVYTEHYYRPFAVPFKWGTPPAGLARRLLHACFGERFAPVWRRNMLAYTMNISPSHGRERMDQTCRLWNSLVGMEGNALVVLDSQEGGCATRRQRRSARKARQSILGKYANTKDFLLDTVPQLREFVQDMNREVPLNDPQVTKRLGEFETR